MKMQNTSHHQNQLGQAAALMIVLFAHFAAPADVSHSSRHGDSAGNNVVSSKSNLGIDHDVTTAAAAGSTLAYSPLLHHQLYYLMPAGGHSLMPYFYQVLNR